MYCTYYIWKCNLRKGDYYDYERIKHIIWWTNRSSSTLRNPHPQTAVRNDPNCICNRINMNKPKRTRAYVPTTGVEVADLRNPKLSRNHQPVMAQAPDLDTIEVTWFACKRMLIWSWPTLLQRTSLSGSEKSIEKSICLPWIHLGFTRPVVASHLQLLLVPGKLKAKRALAVDALIGTNPAHAINTCWTTCCHRGSSPRQTTIPVSYWKWNVKHPGI